MNEEGREKLRARVYLISLSLLFTAHPGICGTAARAQEEDQVIVKGNPPLTASLAGKLVTLLQWSLDVRFSDEQRVQILQSLVRHWQANDRGEINNVLEVANLVDGLSKAGESDRIKAKEIIRGEILKGLQNDPNDEINRVIIQAYEAAHRTNLETAPRSNSSPVTTARNTQRVGADGFTGIYVGVYNPPPGAAVSSAQLAFVTFLPDGHVYWMLPPEGLLYFDPRVARRAYPDNWGTYKIVGDEIHVALGNNLRRVFVREGSKLKLQKYEGQYRAAQEYTFGPLATGDGLKLQGTYRRRPGSPGITFSQGGSFLDEGFTRNFGTVGRPDGTIYQDDGRGGSGTYLIEQNTLELRYADGRVKRFAFTALPENLARQPVRSFRINYEDFELSH